MAIVRTIGVPKTADARELGRWYEKVAERLSYQTYAGDPTGNILPRWVGDRCLDTSGSDWYLATGTAAASWKAAT